MNESRLKLNLNFQNGLLEFYKTHNTIATIYSTASALGIYMISKSQQLYITLYEMLHVFDVILLQFKL